MTDISDLASLNFEDLAQADLFDLVRQHGMGGPPSPGSEVGESSRSSSPSCLDTQESYTHITLINGEQICLRDEEEGGEWGGSEGGSEGDSMDLNSILQAGVVERVAPASPGGVSSTSRDLHVLDWRLGKDFPTKPTVITVESPSLSLHHRPSLASRPRTILASQLPLPVPSNSRLLDRRPAVIISSSSLQVGTGQDAANNNNSLLRSALTGKGGSLLLKKTDSSGEDKVEDILLLSLEGCEAVARLKDGASQLFPNTRVTSEPAKEPNNVISIEVDGSGNLVVHKTVASPLPPRPPSPGPPSPRTLSSHHLAKVRKYHRRSKEEPKKESRLLHYCHICNKGFKDKYSVNVHVRTHTGEKPFSCQLCGKCFRQKAHLAKHQQTHASKQAGGEGTIQMSNDDENSPV